MEGTMKYIILENKKYELKENYKDAFNYEELKEKMTDYFESYDYIMGDYAYGKLRLKGFYKKENKKCNEINNIENKNEYISSFCAYDCKYFLIEKIADEVFKNEQI